MKHEDFFEIMDGTSEQNITELMQHLRFRQIPAVQEDTTMEQTDETRKKGIRMTKRGMITGSAVAAVLLVLNIGLGGYLISGSKHKDELLSTINEEIPVTEAETVPNTTATTGTGTQLSSATVTALSTKTTAAKTAAVQSGTKKQIGTETAVKTTAVQTAATAGTTEETLAKTAGTTVSTAAKTTVQTTAPTPKSTAFEYAMVPADKPYETVSGKPVCHVKPGEQIRLNLIVQNDRGAVSVHLSYNISKFNMLTATANPDYRGRVLPYLNVAVPGNDDRTLVFNGDNSDGTLLPNGTVLATYTLIAPTEPGRYSIQGEASTLLDAEEHNISCQLSGSEIIVDADSSIPQDAAVRLVDTETVSSPSVCLEPVTAHAGQKNVPVNVRILGCSGFVSGHIMFGYDSALKHLLYECDSPTELTKNERGRLGIGTNGTLLEHAPRMDASVSAGKLINVFFNNYRGYDYDRYCYVYNTETAEDARISGDGILFTMYFDMPEECGRYRIYAIQGNVDGAAPECAEWQDIDTFIPCEIVVVP